jgi:type II secretory pathway pseudopilin PulG
MPPTNRRRTTNKMRNARGMQLVEMVVALGLSGVFIVLLSQMMSENMRLGTATATDQMATAALDSLEENMLNMPYAQVAASPATEQIPVVYEDDTDKVIATTSFIRRIPLQQDLTNQNIAWGEFNPFLKQIDISSRWQKGKGPYFRGTLFKVILPLVVDNKPAAKVTLILQFNEKTQSQSGTRTRKREFYILSDDFS